MDTSFREWSVFTIDANPVTDSTVNLTAEPWAHRAGDPSLRYSSYAHGDPYTPIPKAYPGDPFVIRTINISQRIDALHLDGHRFFQEPRMTGPNGLGGYVPGDSSTYNNGQVRPGSAKPIGSPIDTLHYGVSERYTFALDGGAGGLLHQPGDYLYNNTLDKRNRDGAWGNLPRAAWSAGLG